MPFSIRPHRRLPLAYFSGFCLLITLLVQSGQPAYAEWVEAGSNDEAGMTVYMDLDTIRRKENLVKVGICTTTRQDKPMSPVRICLPRC